MSHPQAVAIKVICISCCVSIYKFSWLNQGVLDSLVKHYGALLNIILWRITVTFESYTLPVASMRLAGKFVRKRSKEVTL